MELIGRGYIINLHGKTVTKRRLVFSYRRFGPTYRPLSSRFKQSNKEISVRKFLDLQPQVVTRDIQNKENGTSKILCRGAVPLSVAYFLFQTFAVF